MTSIQVSSRRGGTAARSVARRALLVLALAGGLFAAAAAPAAASAAPVHGAAAAKPAPVPPAGVAVGTTNVPKAHGTAHGIVTPMISWSVSLTATSTDLWPTQYSALTATANADVGPTPYYIDILDESTGALVAHCGTGTVCSVAVTEPTPGYQYYEAYISDATDVDGNHAVAFSSVITVDWIAETLTLTAGAHTLPVGNYTTLTDTTSTNIGPSPFYVQLWDTTTGTLLAQCGSGTTCSTAVTQSVATTHTYLATFGAFASTYPPPQLQSTSATNYVTWTASGMQLTLSAPAYAINGPVTITATANVNVGPTPYYIEIFNENGTRLALCGSGTTCSVSYTPAASPGSNLVAFISANSATLPPGSIQASSNTVTTTYLYIG